MSDAQVMEKAEQTAKIIRECDERLQAAKEKLASAKDESSRIDEQMEALMNEFSIQRLDPSAEIPWDQMNDSQRKLVEEFQNRLELAQRETLDKDATAPAKPRKPRMGRRMV